MKKILTGICLVVLLGGCSKGFSGMFRDYEADALGMMKMEINPEDPTGDRFDEIVENPFVKVSEEPQSTFSVDADGAAYAYFRRMVNMGWNVPASAVRIEEYLNYFTFDYADPTGGETLALNAETGPCPWNPGHRLLRLGLKGKTLSDRETPLANFVFLIDVSGSMDSSDKLPVLKSGLLGMLEKMDPEDQVSIVTYSGKAETLLRPTKVREGSKISKAIKKLTASGCTNGGDALRVAYKLAKESYIEGGNNRIIMGTDGDFNVGVTSTDDLLEMVEEGAKAGIYMTVCGFGTGNLNDSMMETISNHGNGTYEYIDSEDEMMKVFVHERNRFVAVANDTKVQLTFDSTTVDSYRLIGYENRMMANEDFENDDKDAGEIGSGQTVTALYEIIPSGSLTMNATAASFDVRYKKELGEESRLLHLDVGKYYEGVAPNSIEYNFAAGLAASAMILRGSQYKGNADYSMVKELIKSAEKPANNVDPLKLRSSLIKLVEKAEEISKKSE